MSEPWTEGEWDLTEAKVTWKWDPPVSPAEEVANLRLIALAPEMAEWIQEALEWLHSDDGHDLTVTGRALLARARGET